MVGLDHIFFSRFLRGHWGRIRKKNDNVSSFQLLGIAPKSCAQKFSFLFFTDLTKFGYFLAPFLIHIHLFKGTKGLAYHGAVIPYALYALGDWEVR